MVMTMDIIIMIEVIDIVVPNKSCWQRWSLPIVVMVEMVGGWQHRGDCDSRGCDSRSGNGGSGGCRQWW